ADPDDPFAGGGRGPNCETGIRKPSTTRVVLSSARARAPAPARARFLRLLYLPFWCRMPEQLTGVIERITFHNLDNGYCVLRVQARGHRDLVTVVGHCQQVVAGEYVSATGDWVTDRTHGLQFKADELKTTPPHTAEGIAKYLGSGLVKGIGPRYAKRIVDVFGENTLDVIDQSPTFLSQVKGIGPKLIEKIRDGWQQQKAVRSIMVFLHSYGIGTA